MDTIETNEQRQLTAKIERALRRRNGLLEVLRLADSELENEKKKIPAYGILNDITERLQALHNLGAGKLFWGDKFTNEESLLQHIEGLRRTAKNINEKIDVFNEKKSKVEKEIQQANAEIAELQLQLAEQKEQEESKKDEFVTKRVIGTLPYRPMAMPWNKEGEDEKRFRKYVLLALLYSILFGWLVPLWQLPVPERAEVVKVPERFAELLKKPEPIPEPKKIEELKPAEKKPAKEEVVETRKKVANTGILAFKNNFADLMDDTAEAKLGANAALSKQGSNARSTARSLVVAQAQSGSGGIQTSSLSRAVGAAGGSIGAVTFSRVDSSIGTAAADDRPLSDGPGPSRTDEEIQIVFDRYKAALYRIYNRELRKNPTLQGKVVLRLTILPDGSVSQCKIESTDIDSAELSAEIIERVKRFNFGQKDNVSALTILYPIDFLPSS